MDYIKVGNKYTLSTDPKVLSVTSGYKIRILSGITFRITKRHTCSGCSYISSSNIVCDGKVSIDVSEFGGTAMCPYRTNLKQFEPVSQTLNDMLGD